VKSRLPARPRHKGIPLPCPAVSVWGPIAEVASAIDRPCGFQALCAQGCAFHESTLWSAAKAAGVKNWCLPDRHAYARLTLADGAFGMSGQYWPRHAAACARPPCKIRRWAWDVGLPMARPHDLGNISLYRENPTRWPTTSAGWAPLRSPFPGRPAGDSGFWEGPMKHQGDSRRRGTPAKPFVSCRCSRIPIMGGRQLDGVLSANPPLPPIAAPSRADQDSWFDCRQSAPAWTIVRMNGPRRPRLHPARRRPFHLRPGHAAKAASPHLRN